MPVTADSLVPRSLAHRVTGGEPPLVLLGQLFRFGLVGLSGLAVGLASLNLVMWVVPQFLVANIAAFFFASSWNFVCHRAWTFAPTHRDWWRQWAEFLAGSLNTSILNWAVSCSLYYSFFFFETHYNLAAIAGAIVAAGANFLWAKFIVFRPAWSRARKPRQ